MKLRAWRLEKKNELECEPYKICHFLSKNIEKPATPSTRTLSLIEFIGVWNMKFWTNCRVGMMAWVPSDIKQSLN